MSGLTVSVQGFEIPSHSSEEFLCQGQRSGLSGLCMTAADIFSGLNGVSGDLRLSGDVQ